MTSPRVLPAFSLPGSDGQTYDNQRIAGSRVVLYFYPKDHTPGCTTEACDFRDNFARISAQGVQVFGISPDPIARHESFISKFELPFVLLSDSDHRFAEAMGAWGLKKFMGKEYEGVIRSTFLVNGQGQIVASWNPVKKVDGHVSEVLEALAQA